MTRHPTRDEHRSVPNYRATRRLALTLTILLAASAALACRSDRPEPAPTPTATATATPVGFPAQDLRSIDWKSAAVLDELRKHFNGGEVEPKRVAYADLTGDGQEDALVIVESGGTLGDLGAAVYSLSAGRASVLAWIDRGGQIELRLPNVGPNSALIIVKQGLFAAGDANCCPSRIKETTLRWDGSAFAIFGEQTVPR